MAKTKQKQRKPTKAAASTGLAVIPTAEAIAAEIVKALPALPAGAVAHTAGQVIAAANAPYGRIDATLPRDNIAPQTPFGPGIPVPPAPINPPGLSGRAQPRRYEYPVTWNLPGAQQRLVPFQVLRDVADNCDLVRRCISIRKSEIVGLEWDFTISDSTVDAVMAATGEKNRVIAESKARDKYSDQIEALRQFWTTPDRGNGLSMSDWLFMLLEEHFVLDAVTVYPRPTLGANTPGLPGKVHSFEVLDGSTIRPLIDAYGNTPAPPAPAYQQVLYGFPRGEFMAYDDSAKPNDAWSADRLIYRPRERRTWTPYGFPPVEQALPLVDLYLKRAEWLRAEYGAGARPNTWLKPMGEIAGWTPDQRRSYEIQINADLAGDTIARHHLRVLPPGLEPVDHNDIGERYKAEYDEHIIKQLGSYFDVMPTQLGIVPRSGLGGKGHQDGEAEKHEDQAKQPLLAWIVDLINDLSCQFLGADRAITAVARSDKAEDTVAAVEAQAAALAGGVRTLNQIAAERGDPLYEFDEADMPFVVTPHGLTFLEGAADREQETADAAVARAATPPAVVDTTSRSQPTTPAKPAEPSAAAEEARKFAAYAKKRQGAQWRDFRFDNVDQTTADALNKAGAAGNLAAVAAIVADIPKASAPRGAYRAHLDQLAAHWQASAADALASSTDPAVIVAGWASMVGAKAADDVWTWLTTQAWQWDALRRVLRQLWVDAYAAGYHDSWMLTPQTAVDVAGFIDWSTWRPGDPAAAAQLMPDGRGAGLRALLDDADATIAGISATTIDRVATALAQGLAAGDNLATITKAVAAVLGDTDRAARIAATETARAMGAAALDAYRDNGVEAKEWLTAEDERVCPVCEGNGQQDPIPVEDSFDDGSDAPPAHPDCRCAIAPATLTMPGPLAPVDTELAVEADLAKKFDPTPADVRATVARVRKMPTAPAADKDHIRSPFPLAQSWAYAPDHAWADATTEKLRLDQLRGTSAKVGRAGVIYHLTHSGSVFGSDDPMHEHPNVVKTLDGEYVIVDGHHRLAALLWLGATKVKCLVVDMDDIDLD